MEKEDLYKIVIGVLLPLVLIAQTENWIYTYNGPGNYADEARSIVYGLDGNIYAAGRSTESTYIYFIVTSLTTAGDTNWIYKYILPNYKSKDPMTFDEDGACYYRTYTNSKGKEIIVSECIKIYKGYVIQIGAYTNDGSLRKAAYFNRRQLRSLRIKLVYSPCVPHHYDPCPSYFFDPCAPQFSSPCYPW